MTREELLGSTEYWLTSAAIELWRKAKEYKDAKGWSWRRLGDELGLGTLDLAKLREGDLEPGEVYYRVALGLGYYPDMTLKNKEDN